MPAHRPGRRRYWAEAVDLERRRAWLGADEARHVLRVMRLTQGDTIEVIDGSGRLFEVEIAESEPGRHGERGLLTWIRSVAEPPESAPLLWLAQALIRPLRLELLLDSATQLGLAGVLLFRSARTPAVARIGSDRRARILRVMRAATTQSLGLRLPELRGPVRFAELPEALGDSRIWVAHGPAAPAAADSGPAAAPAAASVGPAAAPAAADSATAAPATRAAPGPRAQALVVGPEGGLTEEEVAALVRRGGRIIDLGPRRLRAETAALVGLALLSAALRGESLPSVPRRG